MKLVIDGAPAHVLLTDDEGRYWDPDLESSRVRRKGSPPYEWDNDYPFA